MTASRRRFRGHTAGDSESSTPDPASDRSYIIPGQDAKGHSERIWCRVMPGHRRALGMIVASQSFPFRTMGDVIRWCIDHGIRELDRRRDSGPSVMRQVDVIMAVLQDEMYQQRFLEVFPVLQEAVSRHTAANAMGEARRLVASTKHQIEGMPEGYWRDRYLKELHAQFGHLLSGEGVALTMGAGERGEDQG